MILLEFIRVSQSQEQIHFFLDFFIRLGRKQNGLGEGKGGKKRKGETANKEAQVLKGQNHPEASPCSFLSGSVSEENICSFCWCKK